MTIDELMKKLTAIKEEHGGQLEIIDGNDDDLDFVEVQKYIEMTCDYNDIIRRDTEDLDENYLEESYINNEEYKHRVVGQGKCVKIY